MTLKNNRAPVLSYIKLYTSLQHRLWFQTGVTVRKRLSWIVTSVTLTFDLWLWHFAWTSPWSLVIIPENFMMIDGGADGQTDRKYHSLSCLVADKNNPLALRHLSVLDNTLVLYLWFSRYSSPLSQTKTKQPLFMVFILITGLLSGFKYTLVSSRTLFLHTP